MRLLSSTGLPLVTCSPSLALSLCAATLSLRAEVFQSHISLYFFPHYFGKRRSGDTPRLRCSFFFSRFLKVKQILQIFIPTGSENVFLWLTLSLLNWQMKKMAVRTWGLSAAPLSLMSFHPSFNTKSSWSAVCLSAALLLLLDQLLKNWTWLLF